MADDFNTSTNWWDSSRARFDSTGSSSSSSGQLNSLGGSFNIAANWPSEMVDVKARSSIESASVSDSSVVFHDTQKLQHGQDSSSGDHLQVMALGLSSSHAIDWNQTLLRGDKHESSFRSMLQENLNSSTSYNQQETGIGGSSQVQWRERVFSGVSGGGGGNSSMNEFNKQMNPRGFSLDQSQFSPHGSSSDSTVTCQGLKTSFQMESAAIYGSPSTMLQRLLGSDNQHHQHQQQQQQQPSFENRSMNYPYGANYCITSNELVPSWSKVPQFLRNSPPKQSPQSQLHFSNNAPFWNASASSMNDVCPSFFPPLQQQFPTSSYEEKPKNISEVRESSSTTTVKKSGSETATKRPRNETASTVPAFKVRKEKMGDRITALQQLVSPFGKTDTASVLSEAIEYIKFLHEQVTVLSTPYMKSGAPIHHQQSSDKSKDPEGQKQADLRSRGLCLVPVSITFPVTHETTVDYWTPTFGGTFR
ncbi:transcription factor bHLH123 isoform X2 [Ricinus communis]|nr:transcription factor bHLH123 isoform X2 [Ricinus communis]